MASISDNQGGGSAGNVAPVAAARLLGKVAG